MYVLVLGLDVLGNPFGLLRGMAEGIEDLFYEPYQVNIWTLYAVVAKSIVCVVSLILINSVYNVHNDSHCKSRPDLSE